MKKIPSISLKSRKLYSICGKLVDPSGNSEKMELLRLLDAYQIHILINCLGNWNLVSCFVNNLRMLQRYSSHIGFHFISNVK